jgi:heptose I phosphotransferase
MDIVTLNAGSVRADKEFLQPLATLGLDTLEGAFSYSGEGYLRTHANRDNFHITAETDGRSYEFFLKRHRGFELKEALKFLMTRRPFRTAGGREWDNILRLCALGIRTARPVAFGRQRFLIFERKSYLITERIRGGTPFDDYVKERLSGRMPAVTLREKHALLWDLGDLVRRLHRAGFTHMDLYLNHFFVSDTPEGDKALYLIDLQRLAKRWIFRKRWIVKDLAAILYSTRNLPLTRTDLARILMAYFDGAVSAANRKLVRAAISRARRMAARHA